MLTSEDVIRKKTIEKSGPFFKNLFSSKDMIFYSNGFQLELIDSTQPDNQIVLPGDSLLPDKVI